MKRGTPGHFKMDALCELLNVPRAHAVGIMEMLWQYTADKTPQGDIGKASDRAIANAVGWDRDPSELIESLISVRWLDRSEEHRLVVHDWSEHCEDSVRKWLRYRKLPFIQEVRDSAKVCENLRECAPSREAEAEAEAEALRKPRPEVSTSFAFAKPLSLAELQDQWFTGEFWPAYWRKVDKAAALASFRKHARTEQIKQRIVDAVIAHAPQYLRRDPEHRPHAATWLNKRRYEEPPEDTSFTPPPSRPHRVMDLV